ncbi:unnamed protein product, partial [Toxocara canis]|uniref:Secreted protein n=1 Tax=Toxocara canis TaxID=6265 RepID=A0A183U7N3_TOXCA
MLLFSIFLTAALVAGAVVSQSNYDDPDIDEQQPGAFSNYNIQNAQSESLNLEIEGENTEEEEEKK